MQDRMRGRPRLICEEDNRARHSTAKRAYAYKPKAGKTDRARLAPSSPKIDEELRDLTAAINGMWDKLEPRLLPGAIPAIGHPTANAAPAQLVERMTTAILNTLDMYERGRNVKTRQHGSAEGMNVR